MGEGISSSPARDRLRPERRAGPRLAEEGQLVVTDGFRDLILTLPALLCHLDSRDEPGKAMALVVEAPLAERDAVDLVGCGLSFDEESVAVRCMLSGQF